MQQGRSTSGFCLLGTEASVSDVLINSLEAFTCSLYCQHQGNINEARYCLFQLGNFSDEGLPPNKDCLIHHIMRANYQALIWRRCCDSRMNLPSPSEHGWIVQGDEIELKWMSTKPAPDEALQFVNCGCHTGCNSQRCSCRRVGLKCTKLCKCASCTNGALDAASNEEDDENNYEQYEDFQKISASC